MILKGHCEIYCISPPKSDADLISVILGYEIPARSNKQSMEILSIIGITVYNIYQKQDDLPPPFESKQLTPLASSKAE